MAIGLASTRMCYLVSLLATSIAVLTFWTIAWTAAAGPAESVPKPEELHEQFSLAKNLRTLLPGRSDYVELSISAGSNILVGTKIFIEVESRVRGRLIVLDINAEGKISQIFPNNVHSEIIDDSVAVPLFHNVRIPKYGSFTVAPPVGNSNLIAIVVPRSFRHERLPSTTLEPPSKVASRTKDLVPTLEDADYQSALLAELETTLAEHPANIINENGGWGLGSLSYSISSKDAKPQ